ncbi:MAG: chromate transporter [Quisquiliibacterium sp.]
MSVSDLLELFLRFLTLSLMAVGGAITLVPEMHRYLVDERNWLTDHEFTSSIALAQAAPGPNILFVTLLGWNAAGVPGALATTIGIMLPASVLALHAHRWANHRAELPLVRAFRAGMIPITIGLLLSTAWVLAEPNLGKPALILTSLAVAIITVRTKLNPLWLIAAGGLAGIVFEA